MRVLYILIIALSSNTFASSLYTTEMFKIWPGFSLQHEFEAQQKDMISFEETDFKSLKAQVDIEQEPMVPSTKMRTFTDSLTLKDSNIKWRVFMSATAGSHVSGFSQGIGMTTMLIKDELFWDAQVEHLRYNFDNKYYSRHYEGDKYRVETMLHWYPTDNFSMHLGLGGVVDK